MNQNSSKHFIFFSSSVNSLTQYKKQVALKFRNQSVPLFVYVTTKIVTNYKKTLLTVSIKLDIVNTSKWLLFNVLFKKYTF